MARGGSAKRMQSSGILGEKVGIRHRLPALGLLLAGACAASPAPPPTPGPPHNPGASHAPGDPEEDLRVLDPAATYGDLVERIATLDGRAEETGRDNCILARDPRSGGFELRVELAVGVRPPPSPPLDLDGPLKDATGIRLISRFGTGLEGDLVAVELTATRPTRESAALVLTDQGAYLAAPGAEPWLQGPGTLESLMPAITELASRPEPARLVVLAEAGLPLEELDAALFELQPGALAVSLATALPEDTRLPEAMDATAGPTCPEGLPPMGGEAGSLDLAQVQPVVAPFAETARVCAHQAGGRAMAGGLVELAIRVGPDGRIQQTCSLSDSIGAPALLECLSHAAARLRFPEPGGSVDLSLPLRLTPAQAPVPLPTCK